MKPLLIMFGIALLVGCNSNPPAITTVPSMLPPNSKIFDPANKPLKPEPRIEQHGDNSNSLQTALVIGNSHYDYSPLQNPVHDAKAMTQTLVEMGFSVTQGTNLNYQKMQEVVQAFEKRLSGSTPESVALFYFSGHGAQVGGQNFLIPVNNNDIKGEADLTKQAVLVQNVLAMMEKANNGVNILVLDASCNNPYEGSIKSKVRGLARMAPPRGAVIAFAAAPGQAALDGNGLYSLYTSHLIRALKNAQHNGTEDVFMEVRKSVLRASEGKQEPWHQSSLSPIFCFGGCQ